MVTIIIFPSGVSAFTNFVMGKLILTLINLKNFPCESLEEKRGKLWNRTEWWGIPLWQVWASEETEGGWRALADFQGKRIFFLFSHENVRDSLGRMEEVRSNYSLSFLARACGCIKAIVLNLRILFMTM